MTVRWGLVILAVIVAILLTAPFWAADFTITLLNYIGIYALVALGVVLLTGVGGLTSFGQAAFVGIGAYATAWLTTAQGASPWLGLLFALALTGIVAAFLGAITLRLGGHFLPLGTIAWGLSIFFLFGNLETLGRNNGLGDIPAIAIGPISLAPDKAIFYLIWGVLAAATILVANLLNSREGRAIRSLRGGVVMVESLGISVFRIRILIFIIAALLAALSGWLYAHMTRYVSPAPFDLRMGIQYLFMAILGGAGHILGAVVGAALITLLQNGLQDLLPHFAENGQQLEVIVFAVIYVLVLQFARGGVMPFVLRYLPKPTQTAPIVAEPLPRRAMPQAGTPLLTVQDLRKRFGGLVAVGGVGFEVKAGEIIGLIGPNGAGKSTMFNLITGALKSDEGTVVFSGEDITRAGQRRIARAGIARTFQHVKLRPTMTLIDNVLLGTYVRTRSGFLAGALRLDRGEEARARAEALAQLKRVGLGDQAYGQAGSLPLGRQRILEVARALAADPALIILDEPAAGLSRPEKLALAGLLQGLRQEGVTVLLVEHDVEFVMGLVDRIVVMDFGSKLVEGLPAAVRADPRVQEAYLGQRGMTALLEIKDLHVAYGKVEAVRGVGLRMEPGQIVTVIGPNGAGKTTLLAAAAGLLRSRGEVIYDGADVEALDVEDRVERGFCLVPETRELFGEMTVADNLLLGGYTRRRDRSAVKQSLQQIYARFPRLDERKRQKAQTLSGGERQMLALGRALMAKPRLLLLDEPSLGLAPIMVREILRIVASLRELGVSILLVEQNARAALETADYGYVLEMGEITHQGPAASLAHDPRVVATYLGGSV